MKTTYLREIRNQQPGIILLGDSALDRGVDVPQLTETLGKSVYKLGIDGSASAVWYLALKNSILESSHHSPYLVLFFRGTLLTPLPTVSQDVISQFWMNWQMMMNIWSCNFPTSRR